MKKLNIRLYILKILRKYFIHANFDSFELCEIAHILRRSLNVKAVYSDDSKKWIPVDQVIFPRIFSNNYSESHLPLEISKELTESKNVFVNVGAHVGITASDIIKQINPVKSYLYEPDPLCYQLLCLNLSATKNLRKSKKTIKNNALDICNDSKVLFHDTANTANNSLLITSIKTNDRISGEKTITRVLDIKKESLNWLHNEDIFYMSDAQGLDETLFNEIPDDVFNQIKAGKIEIFSIPGKSFDTKSFLKRIKLFSKIWIKNGEIIERMTFNEVENILENNWSNISRDCFDIIFQK